VGFKGRQGQGDCMPFCGDTTITWREMCPCLNPLGSTGKRPGGPERSVAALRPFNLWPCPAEERESRRGIGVKKQGLHIGV
jgi:hypothetical protein